MEIFRVKFWTSMINRSAVAHFHSPLPAMLLSLQLPTHPNTLIHTQWEGTALFAAVEYGHEDVIELLLEAKADPDIQKTVL